MPKTPEKGVSMEPLIESETSTSSFVPGDNKIFTKFSLFVLLYTLVGALTFFAANPDSKFLDALYFSVVTLTTVGYGDLLPQSDVSRGICMIYAAVGLIFFGVVLAQFGQKVVEKQKAVLDNVQLSTSNQVIENLSHDKDEEVTKSMVILESETITKKIFKILLYRLPLIVMIGIFGIIVGRVEKWSLISSLYFSCMTSTTIGYGDFAPETKEMKILALFFIPLSVGIVGETLGALANAFVEKETERVEAQYLQRKLTVVDLKKMDTNDDEKVTKVEFIVLMLKVMNKVDSETIERISNAFHRLDKDGNGYLDKEDVIEKTSGMFANQSS
jgi:potassium channel subfamily K